MSAPATATAVPARPRIGWMDTARGTTMILVVLLHADVVMQLMHQPVRLVMLFDQALFPLRMPMFFLVSGMLSARLVAGRPMGEVLQRRVIHFAWLYALWLGIYAFVHLWLLRGFGPPELQRVYATPITAALALRISWTNLWFLYALAMFYAVALSMRRLPPWLQAVLSLAIAVPGMLHLGQANGWPVFDRFYHFPYFMAGILGSQWLQRQAPRVGRPWLFIFLGVTTLHLAALAHVLELLQSRAVIAALSLLAMPVELGFAVWLTARLPKIAAGLQLIGRNTLAVYCLHTIALRLLFTFIPPPGGWMNLPWLLALALAACFAAVGLGRLLQPIPGLFGLPLPKPAGNSAGEAAVASRV